MTIGLMLAAWTLVLAFAQILLFDIARTAQYGLKWNTGPRDGEMPPLSDRAQRLKRAQDNLFETLAEEIEEGRALYKRRVSPDLYSKNYYDRALVDILIKAKGHIKSKIW